MNQFEKAILDARAKMEIQTAELAETAENDLQYYQRIVTECAMEFVRHADEDPEPELLLQRIRKMKTDCRAMYLLINTIYDEAGNNKGRISLDTWKKIRGILGEK